METRPPRRATSRHAGTKARLGVRRGLELLLTAALTAGAVFGAALALNDPRFKELLDVRIGPGNGQSAGQQDAGPSGEAGQPPRAEGRMGAPPPGLEESDAPLSAANLPPLGSDSYRFLAVNGAGSPVGYSPCRPLHYVINDGLAPAG